MKNKIFYILISTLIIFVFGTACSKETVKENKVQAKEVESNLTILGNNLQEDSKVILTLINKSLNSDIELNQNDNNLVLKFIDGYRKDFYTDESYKKYTSEQRILIDDVWFAKVQLDQYFKNKKDTMMNQSERETSMNNAKKGITNICSKYLK